MAIYTFINGDKKYSFRYNPRVCVNGVIKKIVEGYTFISGVRKKLFGEWSFENDMLCTTNKSLILPVGKYEFILRGGGGSSGSKAQNGNKSECIGGNGGSGGKGQLVVETRTLTENSIIDIYVGAGGRSVGNSGIGNGGHYGSSSQANGGWGGDGGRPSFVVINDEEIISANGGGGGGGGGGANWDGRNADGGAGGGGGGYYKISTPTTESVKRIGSETTIYLSRSGDDYILDTTRPAGEIITTWNIEPQDIQVGDMFNADGSLGYRFLLKVRDIVNNDITFDYYYYNDPGTALATITIENGVEDRTKLIPQYTSIAGKNGANAIDNSPGVNGTSGNQEDFPNVYSGGGGKGYGKAGSNGAYGGGASGGSGGGTGNHSGRSSGAGGGGAGGDNDASCGQNGQGRTGSAGYNYHFNPTDVLTENNLYGVNADYGKGGAGSTGIYACNDGSQGFVLIRRIA